MENNDCVLSAVGRKKEASAQIFCHQEMIQTEDGRRKSSDELFDGFRGGDRVPRSHLTASSSSPSAPSERELKKMIPHLWTTV